MEKYSECPLCTDIYGANENDVHAPKILKCGDTLCKQCLEEAMENDNEDIFNCPICNKNIKKESNIDEYTTNKEIMKQINSLFNIHDIEDKDDTNKNQLIKYRVILLGNSGVGKTSILLRLLNNKIDDCLVTVGCEPRKFYIKYKNKKYQLLFFDTAGHEKYRAVARNFLRNTDAVLFVFDISNKKSFEDLSIWYNLYREENKNVVGLLLGNKSDLEHKIDEEEADEFAKEHGLLYMETSAKSDKNIKKAIAYLIKKINESNIIFESLSSVNTQFSLHSKKNKKIDEPNKKKCSC